jgi:hypothetical protein
MLNVIMLSVVMLNVIMLSVVMLNGIMLNVIMPSLVMLNVIMLSVVMLNVIMLNVVAPSIQWKRKRVRICQKDRMKIWSSGCLKTFLSYFFLLHSKLECFSLANL